MASDIRTSIILDDNLSAALAKAASNVALDTAKMEAAAKKAEAQTNTFGTSLKNLAVAAGGLYALKKASDFMFGLAMSADKGMQSQALLTNALGRTSEALNLQAQQLQTTRRYEDDETTAAQALAAAYIKDEAMLLRLIPVAQDYATAKRTDLVSATDVLVKSIVSETNMLKRSGIEVDGTARTMERFESVIKNVTTAFGGAAEAMGGAGMGPWVIFRNQINALGEDIGSLLIPKLSATAGWLQEMVTGFRVVAGLSLGDPKKDMALVEGKIAESEARMKKLKGQRDFLAKEYPLIDLSIIAGQWDRAIEIEQNGLFNLYIERSVYEKKIQDLKTKSSPSGSPFADLGEIDSKPSKPKNDGMLYDPMDAHVKAREAYLLDVEAQNAAYESKLKAQSDYQIASQAATEAFNADRLAFMDEFAKLSIMSTGTEYDQKKAQLAIDAENYKNAIFEKETFGVITAEEAAKMRVDIGAWEASELEKLAVSEANTAKMQNDAKLASMRSFSSNIGTLLETAGKKSKAAAIAARVVAMGQAAVNTAVAATKAYEVGMSAGFPVGLVLGPAAAIAAAIAGGVQMAAIASQKFAGGGIVGGNSYSGDKIPAQLNSGEVVFNSRQQAELLLNLANGGGRGGPTISVGGDTIIVNGSADRETIKAIRKTRQDQLLDLRSMLKELSYYGMSVA